MNIRLIILFIFLIGFVDLHAVTFEEANKMLQAGNASAAAAAYEELITQGEKSSSLYGNLGRAYQQQGKVATASLNYHRALMLNPRQIEVRQALTEMYEKSGVPVLAADRIQKIIEKISSVFFLITGAIFFWSGAFFLVSIIFRSSYKITSFLWRFCLLLIGVCLLTIGWLGDPRVANAHLAIVTAEQGESALSQPVETAQRIAFLAPGSAVTVLSERENWDYCRLPNGENAWIVSSSLSFVNPEHIPDRS